MRRHDDGVCFQAQVEIPVSTADFYFPIDPRPLLVYVDGPVHRKKAQMIKNEETRSFVAEEGIQGPRAIL